MSTSIDDAYVKAQTRKLNAEAQILESSAEHLNMERIQCAISEIIDACNHQRIDEEALKHIEKIYNSLLNR